MAEDLVKAIADLEEEEALEITRKSLSAGEDPKKILADSRKAMEIVGERFANSEYFIPDLVYSGEILKQIAEIVKPRLKGASEYKRLGKVIIGTVAGDIHDIGLNIVEFMLDVNGFEVHNLGIDQPAQNFVDKIKEIIKTIAAAEGYALVLDSSAVGISGVDAVLFAAGKTDITDAVIGKFPQAGAKKPGE